MRRLLAAALLVALALPASAATGIEPDLVRARGLIVDARYAAAETLSRQVLAGIRGGNRRAQLDSAATLEVLVESLWKNDREEGPEALALAQRGVQIRERLLKDPAPDLARSLCHLSVVLSYNKGAKQADSLARRAIDIAARAGAPGALAEAQSWHTLGLSQYVRADYVNARVSYRKALEIRQRILPPADPLIGTSYRALAAISHNLEEWGQSRIEWEKALEIANRSLRRDHPDRARCLQGLSLVLYHHQEHVLSTRCAEEALAINEQNLGANHPQVAYACVSLGWSVAAAGDYGRAKSLMERAHRIFLQLYGTDDLRTIDALDRTASIMNYAGDCTASLLLATQALAAARRGLPDNHVEITKVMTTLEQCHECLGHVDSALAVVVEESRRIQAAPRLDVVMMSSAIRREARLRLRKGDADSAIALLRHGLEVTAPRYGPTSPQMLLTEEWLGTALLARGEADSARRIFRRLVATVERVEGRSTSAAAVLHSRVAAAEAACGDSLAAIAAAVRAETAGREAFRATARGFSENEALAAATVRTRGLDIALAIARRMTPPDSVMLAVWDAVVRSRALVADEIAGRHALQEGRDPLHVQLFTARAQYARLLARGPAGEDSIWRAGLHDAEVEGERAERALLESSPALRSERRRVETGVSSVMAAVPAGTGFVSCVRHTDGAVYDGKPMWTALIRGADGRLAVRAIGKGAEVDGVINEWVADLSRATAPDAAAAAEKRCRRSGEAVRRAVWDPMATRLRGATHVVIVPDDALALGNLAALPVGKAQWLIDTGPTIELLSAERDLVADPGNSANALVAFGGIDYDAAGGPVLASAGTTTASERGLVACDAAQTLHFDRLPGTEAEANDVLTTWRATGGAGESRTGSAATEEELRRLAPRAGVLHLATHGFYVDPACVAPGDSANRGVGLATASDVPSPASINPLRLSGLALAGANARAATADGANDGILTAGELAEIDLSNASLVTLSACESGRGQLFSGEGVLGLRRALRVAGARASLMSLWAVRDEPTRAWMNDFYRALWTGHEDLHDAVRSASRAALDRLRREKKPTPPVEWAGIVAEGR